MAAGPRTASSRATAAPPPRRPAHCHPNTVCRGRAPDGRGQVTTWRRAAADVHRSPPNRTSLRRTCFPSSRVRAGGPPAAGPRTPLPRNTPGSTRRASTSSTPSPPGPRRGPGAPAVASRPCRLRPPRNSPRRPTGPRRAPARGNATPRARRLRPPWAVPGWPCRRVAAARAGGHARSRAARPWVGARVAGVPRVRSRPSRTASPRRCRPSASRPSRAAPSPSAGLPGPPGRRGAGSSPAAPCRLGTTSPTASARRRPSRARPSDPAADRARLRSDRAAGPPCRRWAGPSRARWRPAAAPP